MPNKNYNNGRRTEYNYKNILLAEGFDIVQRTAGSHSPVDLLAISEDEVLLVQLKRSPSFPRNKYSQEIQDFANIKVPISTSKRFVVYLTKTGKKYKRGFYTIYEN